MKMHLRLKPQQQAPAAPEASPKVAVSAAPKPKAPKKPAKGKAKTG